MVIISVIIDLIIPFLNYINLKKKFNIYVLAKKGFHIICLSYPVFYYYRLICINILYKMYNLCKKELTTSSSIMYLCV